MRRITATAPIRINDIGGWTDTWFAQQGAVCNIAVEPLVHVTVTARPADDAVTLDNGGNLDNLVTIDADVPGPHPLLEAAVAEVGLPPKTAVTVATRSEVPAGAATGTSAAVVVALVAALLALDGRQLPPHEIGRIAHAIEVDRLGLQSGVQDQLASAVGGVNFITITDYPHAIVQPVLLSAATKAALDERLMLVFLGRGHVSSAVHEKVITELRGEGPQSARLHVLRDLASAARSALEAGDLDGYGEVMCRNTDAQAALHPELVGDDARRVIGTARHVGAIGWKVNGAGGDGGSVTLLASRAEQGRQLAEAVSGIGGGIRTIPVKLATAGVRVAPAT